MAVGGLHGDSCTCRQWGRLDRVGRDRVLASLMSWAWRSHRVQVKLLVRGPGVAVCELISHRPGRGKARTVMAVLCNWSDCAGVRLELTPTDQWGADLGRLTSFYQSLGFAGDLDPEPWLGIERPGLLVRYPPRPTRPAAVGRARVVTSAYPPANTPS